MNILEILRNKKITYTETDIWYMVDFNKNIGLSGWKIHISSQLYDAEDIFNNIINYLNENKLVFKIVKNMDILKNINSSREASSIANKFITIYPDDVNVARTAIIYLYNKLISFKAPKILSDFQCANYSPVHYRFGSYKKLLKYDPVDKKMIHILKLNSGLELEDKRLNYPVLPDSIEDLFTKEEKEKYFYCKSDIRTEIPVEYKFIKILKKSNRGNVYLAKDKDEKKYVIKQARPYIISNNDLTDIKYADSELKNERDMLVKFSSYNFGSNYIDEFYIEKDYFMVQEFIEGNNLLNFVKNIEYSEFDIIKIINQIVKIINTFHLNGYKLVDLSPGNIIITDDIEVKIIDLEHVSKLENNERDAFTKYFFDKDIDINISTKLQDIFSLMMISFLLYTKNILIYTEIDTVNNYSSMKKIMDIFNYTYSNKLISKCQYNWLLYLYYIILNKEDFIEIDMFSGTDIKYDFKKEYGFNKGYDFNKEYDRIIKCIDSKEFNSINRKFNSNEFGEFINPNSYQHGLAGYIFFSILSKKNAHSIKETVRLFEKNKIKTMYIYNYSLLFGDSGYLYSLINLFLETKDAFYLELINLYTKNIISNYYKIDEFDFALGRLGMLLPLMKIYRYGIDLDKNINLEKFLNNSIKEFLTKDFKFEFDNMGFAHGYTGLYFILYKYYEIFKDKTIKKLITNFNEKLKLYINNILDNSNFNFENMDLSWCQGLSGIVLYCCLVDKEFFSLEITALQKLIFNNFLKMGTSMCHGLTSLLITTSYLDNNFIKQDLINILLTRSYRNKDNILMFLGEDNSADYFDFGIGTLGIYWGIIDGSFPFE